MGMTRQWLCMVFLASAALAGTDQPAARKPGPVTSQKAAVSAAQPNIVLVTLDTTRADRMGFLGSTRKLTPSLDALAKDSSVFTRAYAQAPLTPTSHATILTGTYPQFHQVLNFRVPLVKDLPYAPDLLKSHGYHTAAFVASVVLDPSPSYAPGFDRGFDSYDADFSKKAPGQSRYGTIERRGTEVVAHALAWLNKHPKGPFFIWVHLYDAHDPYQPPEPYKTRYAAAPYDGAVAYEDSAVGKLLQGLKARGLYDGAMIAVMADHGESLGAHGEDTHGVFLYDETIRVPLVIKLPRGTDAEKRIENRVELVDVMPTLLQAAGVAVPAEVQGESLMSLMKKNAAGNENAAAVEPWRDRPAYAQADYPRSAFRWSALQSIRTGKYLYIQAPRRELYDDTVDPKAEHNLAPESAAVADTLAGRIEALQQKTTSQREAPKVTVDPKSQEKLAALGYVAGDSNVPKAGASDQGPDPKDKVEISNMVHRAIAFREQGHFKEAVAQLQELIAKEPEMPGMYAKLGDNLLDLKEYDKAIPVLRKAAQMDPESPITHLNLAKGLMGTGDFAGAVPELEYSISKVPDLVDAHVFLETAYARTNRVPETIKECKAVIEYLPDHFGSYLILGRFLELSGDLQGAVPNLKKAAALDPKAPEPHIILADVYEHLGRKSDAARERALGERLAAGAHRE